MKTFKNAAAFEEYFKNRTRGYGQISNIIYDDGELAYQEAHGFFVARNWETALHYFVTGTGWTWCGEVAAEPGAPYQNSTLKVEIEMFKEHFNDVEKERPVWKVTARQDLNVETE